MKSGTIPSDGKIIAASDPKVGKWSATAKWEFETDWSEAEYRRWVIERLQNRFGDPKMTESRLLFVGHFNGDAESLTAQMVSRTSKLRVRVTLEIYPE